MKYFLKKLFAFSLMTLIILSSEWLIIVTPIYAKINRSSVPNYCKINGEIETLQNISEDTISSDGKSLTNAIDKLPKKIKESLYANCTIEIFYGTLSSSNSFNKNNEVVTTGLYNNQHKKITLKGNIKTPECNALHEIGHYVDDSLGNISKQDKFELIFSAEKERLVLIDNTAPGYQKHSSTEYFAIAFAEYFFSPNTLKYNAPQTYAFIEEAIRNF